ncbi:MAG: tetratricopeptide repeat protein [Leptospiraceae bacterium]|nr:tetratricopeptide repeat protein [Leptospiraceae bacterium]MCP5502774.1 tetratricopeptide repeat protein [Leptospiraceae bacterium]
MKLRIFTFFILGLLILTSGLSAEDRTKAQKLNYEGAKQLKADPDKAIGLFEQAMQLDPSVPDYPNNIGVAYLNQKNYIKALSYFQKATKISSNYFRGHYNQGVCYQAMGKNKESVTAYKTALKYNSKSPETFFNLGIVYTRLNKKKSAVKYYKKFLEIAPSSMAKPIEDAKKRIKQMEGK